MRQSGTAAVANILDVGESTSISRLKSSADQRDTSSKQASRKQRAPTGKASDEDSSNSSDDSSEVDVGEAPVETASVLKVC